MAMAEISIYLQIDLKKGKKKRMKVGKKASRKEEWRKKEIR